VLGVILLVLHYREMLMQPMVTAVLGCFGEYLMYLAACLVILLTARWLLPIPQELWRKLLHVVAYTSSLFMMAASGDWAVATVCCLVFAAIVYPLLHLAEGWQGYGRLFNQRRKGEVKASLLLLFCTHAGLIALCWGWMNRPYIAVTAILAWGTGDAAAALVGKRYGRHHVHLPLADGRKTWEGSGAMAATAFAVSLVAMLVTSPLSWPLCLLYAAVAAPVAAWVELITHGGYDTLTVPAATAAVLAALGLLVG